MTFRETLTTLQDRISGWLSDSIAPARKDYLPIRLVIVESDFHLTHPFRKTGVIKALPAIGEPFRLYDFDGRIELHVTGTVTEIIGDRTFRTEGCRYQVNPLVLTLNKENHKNTTNGKNEIKFGC